MFKKLLSIAFLSVPIILCSSNDITLASEVPISEEVDTNDEYGSYVKDGIVYSPNGVPISQYDKNFNWISAKVESYKVDYSSTSSTWWRTATTSYGAEVNGFTGLLGSGRSECVRAIFGADRVINGKVKKNGKEIKIKKPLDAMKQGIAYLPEDRKVDGIIGDLSVRENIILAAQVLNGFFKPFSKAQTYKFADEYIKLLEVKTASPDTPIKSLSGGNQQKVILGRWLLTHPEYLILDEPTRGIDVGTKIEIQKLVLKLASEGMSVTFISSETDEMLRTCSRLIVMRDRRTVGELSGDELNQVMIMNTIAGGDNQNEEKE